ncbi:hypothetical protein L21SP2_1796 [Salinispira pacifica]|uniref:Uncharacterized protein n=1 Tax=Salinispira pacifica TaxID=1307761 RepID=V5WH99_9SPIO|nr:hypothetical protein L21SP2_1796 [Salinispira pacifica]
MEAGPYQLKLYEQSGRFALLYENGDLLFNDNPRSSHTRIRIGDSISVLGEDKSHGISIGEFRDGVALQYVWDDLQVNQHFSFLQRENGSTPGDEAGANQSGSEIIGVKIRYQIINTGTEPLRTELSALFDTVLGELGSSHFVTTAEPGIIREYEFSPGRREPYILSGNSLGSAMFLLAADRIRGPRKIVAANWKRLNESRWEYTASAERNFNLLPFSINDSALNLYFGPERLRGQSSVEYSLIVSYVPREENEGNGEYQRRISRQIELLETSSIMEYNPALHSMDGSVSESSPPTVKQEESAADRNSGMESFSRAELRQIAPLVQDIETLDLLLEQIDRLLTSPARLDESQVAALEEILATIRENLPETSDPMEAGNTRPDE